MPNIKIILLTGAIFLHAVSAQAQSATWDGYDYDNKTDVEIGSGNLVREGSMIQFYESKSDNYHTARVIFVEAIAGGTRVQVLDLDTKKERTLTMREE